MQKSHAFALSALSLALAACGSDSSSNEQPEQESRVFMYSQDTADGAMAGPASYGALEYNVAGSHKMWPTYTTYLLKNDQDQHYKVQILSNYGQDGTLASGNLVVRYEILDGGGVEVVDLDAVDGSAPAKLDLESGATVTDDSWELAYQKFIGFTLNGGISGDGSISGCVAHDYPELYDDEGAAVEQVFRDLTADNTLADFEAVTTDSCDDFIFDKVKPSINTEDWYQDGELVQDNGFIVRHADGQNYSRVSVTDKDGNDIELTIETWDENAQQWDPEFKTGLISIGVNPSTGFKTYYDIDSQQVVEAGDDWDIEYNYSFMPDHLLSLRTNGGASGERNGGSAVMLDGQTVWDITNPVPDSSSPQ
ncbi:hypothetical protein [Vibrio sp. WXL103]|uniref:hypothetical protein n=1 Tax=Vibrio sp. WXL103 TaxID=3450710 RepID=UPI003EC86E33